MTPAQKHAAAYARAAVEHRGGGSGTRARVNAATEAYLAGYHRAQLDNCEPAEVRSLDLLAEELFAPLGSGRLLVRKEEAR